MADDLGNEWWEEPAGDTPSGGKVGCDMCDNGWDMRSWQGTLGSVLPPHRRLAPHVSGVCGADSVLYSVCVQSDPC